MEGAVRAWTRCCGAISGWSTFPGCWLHVRGLHPNATLTSDPNLAELHQAGLRPGTTGWKYAAALVHPLTPRGILATAASVAAGLRGPGAWHRTAALTAVCATAYLVGGWPALVCGVLVPQLLLYPQLASMSLLVEHTWFEEHRTGTRPRLKPATACACTPTTAPWWPSQRPPGSRTATSTTTPDGLLLGTATVAHRHHHALNTPVRQQAAPAATL
ncbi:hypothetical protein [Streptomyces sp. NPDC000229]|uniref:hypothetical protein n=1 Tax=Streptomyces sp. NPDC000229 TaxID=3154247 RepID=UPI003324E268